MGLLDDAIRDHLELKRRHGANESEVARLERDALGPVNRDPESLAAGPPAALAADDIPDEQSVEDPPYAPDTEPDWPGPPEIEEDLDEADIDHPPPHEQAAAYAASVGRGEGAALGADRFLDPGR